MRAIGRPRVVFLGMRCRFSAAVLQSLIDAGAAPAAILLAGDPGEPAGDFPLARGFVRPGTLEAIARAEGIPTRIVAGAVDLADSLRKLSPDLVTVACFPWRLTAGSLALSPLGALNVHPALLPRHRGPEPIFWTFKGGDERTGVTIHEMTGRLDAGPIVEQASLAIPFGVEGVDLERRLAELGGQVLARAIERRVSGDGASAEQDELVATMESFPDSTDLEISTDQSGCFAYAFTRGVVSLGFSPVVRVAAAGARMPVARATLWRPGHRQNELIIRNNDLVSIQFVDGICEFAVNNVRKPLNLLIDNAARPVR